MSTFEDRGPNGGNAQVSLTCPAKVNLALAIDRPDPNRESGLHPIASWMIALNFGDNLTVTRFTPTDAVTPASVFSLLFAEDAPVPSAVDWPLQRDLAFRAHRLLEEQTGRALPVRVDLVKRIPTGAGLGGGSSDAAGMILALDRLFDLRLEDATLSELAEELGSDVHFALAAMRGNPSAVVTGFGDQIETAPLAEPIHLVLVLPPFGCPTGPVYAAWDRWAEGTDHVFDADRIQYLARQATEPQVSFFNDLEPAAIAVEPQLGQLLQTLRHDLNLPAHVTGSGAACFVPAHDADEARRLAETIAERTRLAAIATQTLQAN